MLHPYIDEIYKPLDIAKDAAKVKAHQLALFSVPTLYTEETLEKGKSDVDGMILAIPWHPKLFKNHPFSKHANDLWKAPVNWRTAMAYDSTGILIQALKSNSTRTGVQEFLKQKGFSYEGATGKIEFLESGDRKSSNIAFVKVQPNKNTKTGYEFVPLQE